MRPTLRLSLAIGLAIVIAAASGCDGIVTYMKGRLSVTNLSAGQSAVVAILLPDAKSYPTLAAGASASVETSAGGGYEIRVVMSPSDIAEYMSKLEAVKTRLAKLIDGSASTEDKTQFFSILAQVNTALAQAHSGGTAGCQGTIKLETGALVLVSASVEWVPNDVGGFWRATCGSA